MPIEGHRAATGVTSAIKTFVPLRAWVCAHYGRLDRLGSVPRWFRRGSRNGPGDLPSLVSDAKARLPPRRGGCGASPEHRHDREAAGAIAIARLIDSALSHSDCSVELCTRVTTDCLPELRHGDPRAQSIHGHCRADQGTLYVNMAALIAALVPAPGVCT